MTQINIPSSAMEPFNAGRSAYRLLFDFGALADRHLNLTNIKAIIGNGMELPFPDGFFSQLDYFDILRNMNDSPKTFQEMSRVFAPGGRPVFIEPGTSSSRSEETVGFIETYKKTTQPGSREIFCWIRSNKSQRQAGFPG